MSCDSSHPQSSVEYTQEAFSLDNEEPEDNNNNDVADFKYYNSTDQIYREYDPPRRKCVSAASWKKGRPTYLKSWLRCILSSFIFTVLRGTGIAVVAILFVWLKISLGAICRNFNVDGTWYKLPEGIQKALLTDEVIECMLIECWYISVILPIFGWKLVKKLNILLWSMFAASIDAIYRLLLNVYCAYNTSWSSYPLNILFATSILFISYKVSSHYRQFTIRQRLLAFKLGAQFYVGFPVALIMNNAVSYYFNIIPEKYKAVLASLFPALVIISKVTTRLCAEKMEGINHPGTSVLLLISLYTVPTMLLRVLQAKLHSFWMYFMLSIVHGIESTFDKITLPLQDYIIHRCCAKRQQGHISRETKPRVNRLFADLAIVSMIAESTAIIFSSVVIQLCRYYYGRDDKGRSKDPLPLFEAGCWQVITGITVEFFFNIIAIKIQTYYYNIPIIRVWKNNKRWLTTMLLINMFIGIFYFDDYLYRALRGNEMFDQQITHKCTKPF